VQILGNIKIHNLIQVITVIKDNAQQQFAVDRELAGALKNTVQILGNTFESKPTLFRSKADTEPVGPRSQVVTA
jgi:hypothetical protein